MMLISFLEYVLHVSIQNQTTLGGTTKRLMFMSAKTAIQDRKSKPKLQIKLLGRPLCGLISALEGDKYLHVKESDLTPAYPQRYDDVAGFKEDVAESKTPLAAAQLNGEGFHIRPDGTPAYEQRYTLVMDFESPGRAKVTKKDGTRCFITFFDDGDPHEFGSW